MTKEEAMRVQHQLIALGYPLPRYGADGEITEQGETWKALEDFASDHLPIDLGADGLSPGKELDAVVDALLVMKPPPRAVNDVQVVDLTGEHARKHVKGLRAWKDINAIVLHQTAFRYLRRNEWYDLRAHIGIASTEPEIYVVNPLNALMWHANGFNAFSVGIEISGSYPGLSGRANTHWKPPSGYDARRHGPHEFSEVQAQATRAAIRYVCDEVARHQGEIRHIFAHRQSSKDRIGDPGQDVWQQCGVWAKNELGLDDGGSGYKIGKGYALPDEWTGEERGVKYYA